MSLTSFVAQALGLGEMKVRSFLNQPFDAEIDLTDLDNTPLSGIKADVASIEEFERMGMDRANVLNFLSFNIEKNSAGRPVIRVRSLERIRDPYLQILVDVVWATGQVYRSYTILLDPPAYKLVTVKQHPVIIHSPKPLINQPGVVNVEEDTEVHNNPQSIDDAGNTNSELSYGPTRANETIWQISQRYRKDDVLLQQMILAIVGANPDAFAEGNLNGLKENSRLTIPSSNLAKTIPAEQAKMEVFAHDSAWQSKQPIEHVLFPPYVNEDTTEEPVQQTFNSPLISQIPPAPLFTSPQSTINNLNKFSSYLPKAATTVPAGGEAASMEPQTLQQAKLKAEMDLAIAAIGSVREANSILKEQLVLTQTENKRLLDELKKRDEQLAQLQKEIRLIKTRQGLAGQAVQDIYETDSNFWPWLLILLILVAAGGAGYWWFWLRPQKEEEEAVELPKTETATDTNPAKNYPLLTPLENPVMAAQPVYVAPTVEETKIIKQEVPKPISEPEPESLPPDTAPVVPANAEQSAIVSEQQRISDEQEISAEVEPESNLIEFIEEPRSIEKEVKTAANEDDDFFTPSLSLDDTTSSFELDEPEAEKGLELEQIEEKPSLEFKPDPVITEPQNQSPRPVKSQKALDTLLDLAKTYMSMGDKEAAHQSLEEVLKHGNEQQKTEAENLLKKLDI